MLVVARPSDDVVPRSSCMTEHVREQELANSGFLAEQRGGSSWDGMSTELAVEGVVDIAELALRRLSEFPWLEEFSAHRTVAAKPAPPVFVASIEGPGEVLDLDELPRERSTGVDPAVGEQISARRNELGRDAKEHGYANRFVGAVPPRRAPFDAICAKDVAGDMELTADGGEHIGSEATKLDSLLRESRVHAVSADELDNLVAAWLDRLVVDHDSPKSGT